MALRSLLKKIGTSVEELDRMELGAFAEGVEGAVALDEIPMRTPVVVAGEVRSVRVVPRAGAPACEVTISDGKGRIVAVFLGRRSIPGLATGRKIIVQGVASQRGREVLMLNPIYQFV
ncbi:MAG: OB-fold nucleic acid binding domain-containing protein [Acidimicrobiia bacterium]